jgi:molybdopterin molybdotransferase
MLELTEAQERILAALQPLPAELVALAVGQAQGRFLAEAVTAPVSLPPFDNSAMDGYAVRAADVTAASSQAPVRLRCIGAVPAGSTYSGEVPPGVCVRIFTGSPMPAGADAVVMQEDTRVASSTVEVLDAVKPWENVRLAGQDIKQGALAARAGERLNSGRLALLAALGVGQASAARQPVIGILSTGNELIEPGNALAPGQIYESNRVALSPLIGAAGGIARALPLVRDNMDETIAALRGALDECDAVLTTGGVSVGEHDLVKAAFESLGGSLEFWKVNVKPGKPFVFGRLGEKLLFGLPGNPVSAFVTFLLLVRPAILKMQGATDVQLPSHPAVLAEDFQNRGDRRHFVRVAVDEAGVVRSTGLQASHALNSLAAANGLMDVPARTSWEAGRTVAVLRWEM